MSTIGKGTKVVFSVLTKLGDDKINASALEEQTQNLLRNKSLVLPTKFLTD